MNLCKYTTPTAITILFLLVSINLSVAQTEPPCGNVITPADFYFEGSGEQSDPIQNCANPFERTGDLTTLRLNNQSVQNNASYVVPTEGTADYSIGEESYFQGSSATYYKHSGQDLIRVNVNYFEPTRSDIETALRSYFNNNESQVQKYTEIYLADYRQPYFYDEDLNQYYYDGIAEDFVWRVYAFAEGHIEQNVITKRPLLLPGTYTVVQIDTDEGANPSYQPSLIQKIFTTIIPTAHAYYYVNTVTFTLAGPAPEPEGASSVLFLPGIMGSRLYEKSPGLEAVCGIQGPVIERWFSRNDCDQLRLITDAEGNSVYDVYTNAEHEDVIDEALLLNLYKTFFNQLADWKEQEKIKDYALIPYDWRLRLDELLTAKLDTNTNQIQLNPGGSIQEGYLYMILKRLSDNSYNNKKVTMVAHSNGGLLAKALLARLEETNDPLLDKVDNLILVASPQVGTPDTIMGMLHGTEIGPLGSIISRQTSRTLLNTMPFAYHLLPNQSYFDGVGVTIDTPVITFEQGTVTTPWINSFGQTITDATTLQRFMTIDSGRVRPSQDNLQQPEVIGKYLFDNYTENINQLLNTWVPPETMQVKEIAGVGIETLSGIEYFTDTECIVRNPLLLFKCTAYAPKLGMRPTTTFDGDSTVVTPSALALSESNSNVERWWLNLFDQDDNEFIGRVHKDIFEVADVRNLISNTIFATTSAAYIYLTNTPALLPNEKRLTFTLHSPLDLVVTDSRGTMSSSTETIDGGIYRRFGEVQYISIPDNGNPTSVKLAGEASGSFTLEIATYNGNELDKRHSYTAIPSSTSTIATLVVDTDFPLDNAQLQVDYDGNGTSDITYDTRGEIIPVITYGTLIETINALPIKSLFKKLLLENAKLAQQYDVKSQTNVKYKKLELIALEVLKQQVLLYERSKILTSIQRQELLRLIGELGK